MTTGVSFKAARQSSRNQAVQLCLEIWHHEYNQQRAKGKTEYTAGQEAHQAFRDAMPDLISETDNRDFIACVGRGILIGAIDNADASRLLAAARIASQSIAAERKAAAIEDAASQKLLVAGMDALARTLENDAA